MLLETYSILPKGPHLSVLCIHVYGGIDGVMHNHQVRGAITQGFKPIHAAILRVLSPGL
jgi:hypothetical protein